MNPVRFMSRSLLGAQFVYRGIDVLRNPEPQAKAAAPVLTRISDAVPALPQDPVRLVQLNAGLHVTAGALLILGKMPRLSALALAGSMVPTTIAGQRFWEEADPQRAVEQRAHLAENAAVLGGLLATVLVPSGRRARSRKKAKARTAGPKVAHAG